MGKVGHVTVQRIKDKIGELLKPCEKGSWPSVRDRPNHLLADWSTREAEGTDGPVRRGPPHSGDEAGNAWGPKGWATHGVCSSTGNRRNPAVSLEGASLR